MHPLPPDETALNHRGTLVQARVRNAESLTWQFRPQTLFVAKQIQYSGWEVVHAPNPSGPLRFFGAGDILDEDSLGLFWGDRPTI